MFRKTLACLLFFAGCCAQLLFAQTEKDVLNYINKYKQYAIEEQLRTAVPAAVTLAQGIHETSAGNSELATQANNHFGIKCKSNWTGETFLHDDDRKQECFRKYPDALQSYIDHSDFLRGSSRYQSLFTLEVTDYAGWAAGLKKAGYATNPAYVKHLTDLVEKYNLQQFTYDALSMAGKQSGEIVPDRDAKNPDLVDDPNTTYKGLKGFWAKKGETLQQKAAQYDIKYQKLLEINDLPDEPLPFDMFVFTERKKKTGTVEFHLVKEGEDMLIISQKEAISLNNLYHFNHMQVGDEPLPGEQLALQYRAYSAPRLVAQKQVVTETRFTEPEIPISKPATSTTTITKTETTTQTETIAQPQVAGNSDIIDVEKAKKVEALLTDNKGKSEITMTQNELVAPPVTEIKKAAPPTKPSTAAKQSVNTATPVQAEPIAKAEPTNKTEPEKKPEKKVYPPAPKRTYNEKNVDDSVKILKERFDAMVYRPFERRVAPVQVKEVSNSEKVITKTSNTGITKELLIKKENNTPAPDEKKTNQQPKNTNTEEKNSSVEKTKTGLVRDAKKIEEEKKKAKESQAAANAKKETGKNAKNVGNKKDNREVLQKNSKNAVKKPAAKQDKNTGNAKQQNNGKKQAEKKDASKKKESNKPATRKK